MRKFFQKSLPLWLLLLTLVQGFAQGTGKTRTVSGTVTNENGEPMVGVGVVTADGKRGTMTDAKGKYSIVLQPQDAVLSFSFLTYTTQEVVIGERAVVDVQLQPDSALALNEAVVIGYGTVKKEDLTGSVATAKMADIASVPTLNVDQALQGRLAGVDILSTTGEPGAATSIRVRGTRSITASNEPLIVVDGVMDAVSDMSEINPSDIESISVLKDASSTAIYGSRGANGVIIVTTRQGASSNATVTVSAASGVSWISKHLDIMNRDEFIRYRNNMRRGVSGNTVPTLDPEDYSRNTDWVAAVTRPAVYQNYQVSVTGKSSDIRYFASLNYVDDRGIIKDSGMNRIGGRLNVSKDFTKWLTVGLKINTNWRRRDRNKTEFSGNNNSNGVLYLSPLIGPYDDHNPYVDNGRLINTPCASIKYEDYYTTSWATTNSLEFILKPVKGLVIKSLNTSRMSQDHTYHFWPNTLPKRRPEEGADASKVESEGSLLSSENTASFKKRIARHHNVDVLAGFSASLKKSMSTSVTARGLVMDELKWNSLNTISSKENYTVSSGMSRVMRESVFGRFNYNYRGRYYVTGTLRADGSSNFAANHKWGLFPSAAVKWNAKKERFLKKVRWVDELALRASAGVTGNDAISAYRSLQAYASSTDLYIFDGAMGVAFYPSRLDNPNLTWEKTAQYSTALEASFLKERIRVEAEAYMSVTTDLLLSVAQVRSTGYSSVFRNLGRTSNKGLELTLETRNISTGRFGWTTAFTISHNTQMVEDIGHEDYVASINCPGAQSYMIYGYKKGYPLNALWGFKSGGVVHNTAEFIENETTRKYTYRSALSASAALGVPRFYDRDHDASLSQKDLYYLGNADPIVYGGLQNTFHYGPLKLGVYFAWSVGGSIYNWTEFFMGGGQYTNQYRYMLGCWTPERPDTDIPRAGTVDVMLPSDRFVYDASFLRLKDVSLSYTFNFRHSRKRILRELMLGVTGTNLWLWSSYLGFDPDVSTDSGDSTLRRVDRNSYPTSRKVVFNVRMKF